MLRNKREDLRTTRMSSDLAQLTHFLSPVPSPILPININLANSPSVSAEIPPSASPTKLSKCTDGATPTLACNAGFAVNNPQNLARTATLNLPEDLELRRLLLTNEWQQLEVQKSQLQLELTKLQASTGPVAPNGSSEVHDQMKLLGDLCTSQRTLFWRRWPHIFAPGKPKLYNDLSIAEFTASYLTIVDKCCDSPHKTPLLNHLADLMGLACS